MNYKILLIVLLVAVNLAMGQTTIESHGKEIDVQEVLISDSRLLLKDTSQIKINILNREQIIQSGSISMPEALSTVPGVTSTSTGPGIGRPVIRGLSGNRIVTNLNGVSLENQQWDPEHGLGLSPFGFDRVEVIKGPATLLYGPGAMGGVLNFIDEKQAPSETMNGDLMISQHSNTAGTIGSVGLKGAGKKWYYSFRAGANNHSDYYGGGDYLRVANSRFREGSGKVVIGYLQGKSSSQLMYQLNTGAYGIVEPFETPGKDLENHPMEFETPYHTNRHHTVALKNNFMVGTSQIKSQVSFQNDNRKELEQGNSEENPFLGLKLNTGYCDIRWESAIYKGTSLVAGTQGMLQQNSNFGYSWLIADYFQQDIGFFALARKRFSKINFEAGIRQDFSRLQTESRGLPLNDNFLSPLNRNYKNLSGSFGVQYYFSDDHNIKFNVGSGFRSPNVSELSSNGYRVETQRFEYGNNNFLKERNRQVDLSDHYEAGPFTLESSIFYNNVSDFIFLAPSGTITNGHLVYQYYQSDAVLYGGEMSAYLQPLKSKKIQMQSSLSYTTGKIGGQYLPLMPPFRLKNSLIFNFIKWGAFQKPNIALGCLAVLRQKRLFENERETPGYLLLNISFNAEYTVKAVPLMLTVGANNLLNQSYYDHMSRLRPYGVYGMGLDVFVNLMVPFDIKNKNKALTSDQKAVH